jgi:hypothetical protein
MPLAAIAPNDCAHPSHPDGSRLVSLFRASDPAADADWSVPTPRGPYPVNPSYPDPDAPTQRLYQPIDEPEPLAEPDEPEPYEPLPAEHRSHRSRGVLLALVIAVLALLASGGASYIAWTAQGRAEAMHMPGTAPVPVTSTVAATSAPAPQATTPEAVPSGYTLKYAQEPLQIKVPCDGMALVDLDAPRLDAPEQESDLRYDNRCGAAGPLLSVGPGGQRGSHITDAEADAPSCADAVDTEPLDPGESVPAQKGTVLCIRTGGATGAQPVLALVEVTGLGANGVASLRATAWTAPATADATSSESAATDQATLAPDDTEPDVPEDDVPSEGAGPGE